MCCGSLDGILHRAHRIDDVARVGHLGVLLARQRAEDLAGRRKPLRAPTDRAVLIVVAVIRSDGVDQASVLTVANEAG